MIVRTQIRMATKWAVRTLGVAVGSYAAHAVSEWLRYGWSPDMANDDACDPLLDRFIPEPEVREHHSIHVNAPAAVTFGAATETDLLQSTIVRSLFRVRELIFGSPSEKPLLPHGLVAQAKALGWGVLAEIPGREIVFGAATQPWAQNVVFYTLAPQDFGRFDEPGYVKIMWNLRITAAGERTSIAHTETRVVSTNSLARRKFRRYWCFFSAGILLIRRILLHNIKTEAERRSKNERRKHSAQLRPACTA